MDSNKITTILDFYTKCNKSSDTNSELSKGEKTILECITIYGFKSQLGLPFDEDKTIRMLFAKDFVEEHLNLKNKNEFEKLRKEYYDSLEIKRNYKTISLEASFATSCEEISGKANESTFAGRYEIYNLYSYFNSLRKIMVSDNESLLEHIYKSCIIAYGIESEFKYCVDFNKVIKSIIFGRINDISILDGFKDKEKYLELLRELKDKSTLESEYAYLCDKTEYDMQQKDNSVDIGYNRIPCFKSMILTYRNAI